MLQFETEISISYQLRVTYYYFAIKEKRGKKTLKGMKGITVKIKDRTKKEWNDKTGKEP